MKFKYSNHKGRAVAPWKRGRLTIRNPGFDPRPGVLFGCEGKRLPCCTWGWLTPPASGVKVSHVCPSTYDAPPWEPSPFPPAQMQFRNNQIISRSSICPIPWGRSAISDLLGLGPPPSAPNMTRKSPGEEVVDPKCYSF